MYNASVAREARVVGQTKAPENVERNREQIRVLNDFFHYGIIPKHIYEHLREILLKSKNDAEVNRVMIEVRSYL